MDIKRTEACPLTPAVFAYYETNDERLLNPVFEELAIKLPYQARTHGIVCPMQRADVVQTATINILNSFRNRKYKPELPADGRIPSGLFWAWAYKVLWGAATKHKTKFLTTPSSPGALEDAESIIGELEGSEFDNAESIINHKLATEAITAVTQALLSMRQMDKECIILVYYKGMTHDEAAKKLGVSRHGFSDRVTRALAQLRFYVTSMGIKASPEIYGALPAVNTGNLFIERQRPLSGKQEKHAQYIERTAPYTPNPITSSASQQDYSAPQPRASP